MPASLRVAMMGLLSRGQLVLLLLIPPNNLGASLIALSGKDNAGKAFAMPTRNVVVKDVSVRTRSACFAIGFTHYVQRRL